MQTDAQVIDELIAKFRNVLNRCEQSVDQPIQSRTLQECRDACRRAALVAERLSRSQDDGK